MSRSLEPETLNLTPILNLVTILIPVLLMAAQLVSLSVIDTPLPAVAREPDPLPKPPPVTPPTLEVTRAGYRLRLGTSPDTTALPCPAACTGPADYDQGGLAASLSAARAARPDASTLVLTPADDVAWDVVVAALDTARGDAASPLYADVVFGALSP